MSVHIEIGKYAIESSATCWQICKKTKVKDTDTGKLKTVWVGFRFYISFESAMQGLFNLKLRTCDAQSVQELAKAARVASSRIVNACAPLRAENALQSNTGRELLATPDIGGAS